MTDKSWMLNPEAIRRAKDCIALVKKLTGERLKLSDPEFIQKLHEYVDMTSSYKLSEAYSRLIAMAGVGNVIHNLKPRLEQGEVFDIPRAAGDGLAEDDGSTVMCSGREYPKFRAGLQFKGLYRGQPRYS